VAGLVHQDHRDLRGDGVQFLAGGVAPFGQLRIVIAEADQHLVAAGNGGVGQEPAHDPLQVRDRIALAIGGGQQVGRQRLQAGAGDMAVAVDEAGGEGMALQVDLACGGAEVQCRPARADKGDAPVAHHHRFDLRLAVVDGEDGAARVQRIGGKGAGGRAGGEHGEGQKGFHRDIRTGGGATA